MVLFNKVKKVYVASPYSHDDERIRNLRAQQVEEVAGLLQNDFNYAFILPITMSHNTGKHMTNKGFSFDHWRDKDLTYIDCCDELWVITLNGWKESIGVKEEMLFANLKGIPVRFIEYNQYTKTVKFLGVGNVPKKVKESTKKRPMSKLRR